MPTELPDDSIVDELATMLFGLDQRQMTTGATTRWLTRAIGAWALERGWSLQTEAHVDVGPEQSAAKLGYMDVVIRRGSAKPDIAIEIDSGDKPWSVTKLQHAAAAGMHAIWVRWGDDEWAGVYEDVDVIQLRLGRYPLPRQNRAQLSFWRSGRR